VGKLDTINLVVNIGRCILDGGIAVVDARRRAREEEDRRRADAEKDRRIHDLEEENARLRSKRKK
jgi:hypothetical protein